jgi:hypothetical protein
MGTESIWVQCWTQFWDPTRYDTLWRVTFAEHMREVYHAHHPQQHAVEGT